MNETSFIAVRKLKVQLLCRRALAYITQKRKELWVEYVNHVNSIRAKRWLPRRRKPLDEEAAKEYFRSKWPMSDPMFFLDDEEARITALLELTFAETVNDVVYLSCGDYSLLTSTSQL